MPAILTCLLYRTTPGGGARLMFRLRASAGLRLKLRGPKAILSREKSRNIPNFGRESQNIGRESRGAYRT